MTTLVQLRDRFRTSLKRLLCQGCFRPVWVAPNCNMIGICKRCPEENGWFRIEQRDDAWCDTWLCSALADYIHRDDFESTDEGIRARLLCIGHARGPEWIAAQTLKAVK